MTNSAPTHRIRRTAGTLLLVVALCLGTTACDPYSDWQEKAHQLINSSRGAHQRQALPMSVNVAKKAQLWANHLADCRCLEHSNLASGLPAGWQALAENVGYGTPGGSLASIQQNFMASPGHRGNILDTRWNVVGTGVAARGTTKYVVQVFARY